MRNLPLKSIIKIMLQLQVWMVYYFHAGLIVKRKEASH